MFTNSWGWPNLYFSWEEGKAGGDGLRFWVGDCMQNGDSTASVGVINLDLLLPDDKYIRIADNYAIRANSWVTIRYEDYADKLENVDPYKIVGVHFAAVHTDNTPNTLSMYIDNLSALNPPAESTFPPAVTDLRMLINNRLGETVLQWNVVDNHTPTSELKSEAFYATTEITKARLDSLLAGGVDDDITRIPVEQGKTSTEDLSELESTAGIYFAVAVTDGEGNVGYGFGQTRYLTFLDFDDNMESPMCWTGNGNDVTLENAADHVVSGNSIRLQMDLTDRTGDAWPNITITPLYDSLSGDGIRFWIENDSVQDGQPALMQFAQLQLTSLQDGITKTFNYEWHVIEPEYKGWVTLNYSQFVDSEGNPPTQSDIEHLVKLNIMHNMHMGINYTLYYDSFQVVNPSLGEVTGVSLTDTKMELAQGNSIQLNAVFDPAYATNRRVTWSSADPMIADVDSKGVVRGVGKGKTTITVTTAEGGFTASCTIIVREKDTSNNRVLFDFDDGEIPAGCTATGGNLEIDTIYVDAGASLKVLPTSNESTLVFTPEASHQFYGGGLGIWLKGQPNATVELVLTTTSGDQYVHTLTELDEDGNAEYIEYADFQLNGNGKAPSRQDCIDFKSVSVTIKNSNGTPVYIDSIKVRNPRVYGQITTPVNEDDGLNLQIKDDMLIDNEPVNTDWVSLNNGGFDANTIGYFRDTWLPDRFGTIAKFNSKAGTSFASFDDVFPTTAITKIQINNVVIKYEWYLCLQYLFETAQKKIYDTLHAANPTLPLGMATFCNGVDANSVYSRLDFLDVGASNLYQSESPYLYNWTFDIDRLLTTYRGKPFYITEMGDWNPEDKWDDASLTGIARRMKQALALAYMRPQVQGSYWFMYGYAFELYKGYWGLVDPYHNPTLLTRTFGEVNTHFEELDEFFTGSSSSAVVAITDQQLDQIRNGHYDAPALAATLYAKGVTLQVVRSSDDQDLKALELNKLILTDEMLSEKPDGSESVTKAVLEYLEDDNNTVMILSEELPQPQFGESSWNASSLEQLRNQHNNFYFEPADVSDNDAVWSALAPFIHGDFVNAKVPVEKGTVNASTVRILDTFTDDDGFVNPMYNLQQQLVYKDGHVYLCVVNTSENAAPLNNLRITIGVNAGAKFNLHPSVLAADGNVSVRRTDRAIIPAWVDENESKIAYGTVCIDNLSTYAFIDLGMAVVE